MSSGYRVRVKAMSVTDIICGILVVLAAAGLFAAGMVALWVVLNGSGA